MSEPLLTVENLQTWLQTADGCFPAVDGVSLQVSAGETLAVVGESGCGKSLTALSIMGLLPRQPKCTVRGVISFGGRDLLSCTEQELQRLRGQELAMVFQEPMTSLNPVLTVGEQLMEGLLRHLRLTRAEARRQAIAELGLVGIPAAEQRLNVYPHQLSGGMRQRVMIAIALGCRPRLLIADEPTTALDVTTQAQILQLLQSLQQQLRTAIMLITHDLGVVAGMADRVLVMYLGRVVEEGPVAVILHRPRHPYTTGLLRSLPNLKQRVARLQQIAGNVPSPLQRPSGCAFHPRCPHAVDRCRETAPPLLPLADGHRAACWFPQPKPTAGVIG